MNIFYQLRRGRVAKTDMVVELTLREIIGMVLSRREIRLDTPPRFGSASVWQSYKLTAAAPINER